MKRNRVALACLLVLCFAGSLCGCDNLLWSAVRPILHVDKTPYVPLTPIDYEIPSIDQPVQSWTYHWPEEYHRILEASCSPVVDEDGNMYFIGNNGYLYSIDPNGEVRWKKKGCSGSMVIVKEGIVVHTRNKCLVHFDFEGTMKWSSPGCLGGWGKVLFLAPNGYVVFADGDCVLSVDSKGKTMWVLPVEDGLLKNCFLDENSNAYLTYFDSYDEEDPRYKEGQENIEYYMISVSPKGALRWRKTICHDRNYITEFTPKDHRIQDTFLVAFSTSALQKGEDDLYEDLRRNPKVIKAFNTDGEELWQMEQEDYGTFETEYTVGPLSQLYFSFNRYHEEYNHDEPSSRYAGSDLRCVSKTGETLWNIPLEDQIQTAPSFDSEGNLYVGTWSKNYNDNLYSFTSDGVERWSLRDIEVACGFNYNLILSPKHKIHFTTGGQSLLFCIEEGKEEE